jgi:error-prone DNA polymerase
MVHSSFVHLRSCSGYSFKYGTATADQLVERATEFGMRSLGLTDRDNMAGAIRFAQACESASIKPILGINLSFIQRKYRITLLATADGGLASLYQLLTAVNFAGGLLTHELLQENFVHTKKLLAMHGPDSQIATAIGARQLTQGLSIYNSTKDYFAQQGIEVLSHRIRGDGPLSTPFAARMLKFARDNNLPAVITNSVRMLNRSDGPLADVLDSARNLVPLHKRHVERQNSEAYLKDIKQMHQVATEISQAAGELTANQLIKTTLQWAEMAMLDPRRDVGIGKIHLPEPSVVGGKTQDDLTKQLKQRCESALANKYFGEQSVVAASRLTDELTTVNTLGYESYFLTVADITDLARSKSIRVAARGSGAGSLICYLLGISGVEPITHGLLMERFCSPLRNELPDIDIDVESARRLEIYDAIFERYGKRVATVSMVETYRSRHAIRDVGAALGISPIEIDLIAKSLPHIRARNIAKALENLPELKSLKLDTPILQMAINLAQQLDGLPRHLSMHPCAIVLSDIGLRDHAPLELNASGYPMVQFDKDDVEAVGFLKLDVLGVRMQSAISYAIAEIERVEGTKLDIDQISLADQQTFDLISSTHTLGVFQIESPGQRELIGKFAPSTFTDLIIDISLFRPGPVKSDMIRPFLSARHGLSNVKSIHPELDAIMQETEGVVVFHEQVIRLISVMTDISLAQADEKRRALGTLEGQQEVCDWFYPAALANNFSLKVVQEIWEILRAFASFGFCKAHAAAFALPTYQSAWLKTHHTAAFIAGVLTHDPGMYPKRLILDDARQWGIEIKGVDVNKSAQTVVVEKIIAKNQSTYLAPDLKSTGRSLQLPNANGYALRISLADVGGISDNEVSSIINGRPYVDLSDFVRRSGASVATTESLIMIGGFDQLHGIGDGLNRRDLLLHLQDLYNLTGKKIGQDQLTLELSPPPLTSAGLPNLTVQEKVQSEITVLGMEVSVHLLNSYGEFLNAIGAVRSSDVIRQRSGASLLIAGVKSALQTPPVRSGRRVMFLTIDDGYGCNDVTFFEDAQQSYAQLLRSSNLFLIRGQLRRTGPRGVSIRATQAWELSSAYNSWLADNSSDTNNSLDTDDSLDNWRNLTTVKSENA